MQAIAYTSYGGPPVTRIIDLPIPLPGHGEAQIKVAAAGLNPIDWHQRQGELKAVHPQKLPVVGGNEFSGTITALGPGVEGFDIGDAVVCRVTKTKWGAMGQYVVMPCDILARAPTSISLVDAAGLPLAGLTADQALDLLKVGKGDRVLITGGAGGVGQFAIQLARLRGAHVTTTASAGGREAVLRAGADAVIDYTSETIPVDSYDKAFDTIGQAALIDQVIPSIRKGGQVVSVGGPQTPGCLDEVLAWWKRPLVNAYLYYLSYTATSAAVSRHVEYTYMFMRPDGSQLQRLSDLVDTGDLVINIDSTYAFTEYPQAFERLESGRAKGKVIIRSE